MRMAVGEVQAARTFPAGCTGTCPVATAPTTVPMKNGVISEETANNAPVNRCSRSRCAVCRKANPTPRRTIPSRDRLSGTNSAVMMAANAGGNAVHNSTRMKISHTWLASQTGVMDSSMSSRGDAPRWALPASRSQIPPPKSAPPNSAYAAMTTNRIVATATASGEGFMDRPARQRMPGARPVVPGARRVKPWPARGHTAPARPPLRRVVPAATAVT